MTFKRSLMLAVLTAAIFALCFTIVWQRRLDMSESEAYGSVLRSLLALDFRLTGELMKARSGLSAHYDGLVQTDLELRAVHARLRRMPKYLSAAQRVQLGRELRASEQLHTKISASIERWKSVNAVLRNSLRFLPQAALALDARAGDAASSRELRGEVDTLVRDVLLLQNVQDPAISRRITEELRVLAGSSGLTTDEALQHDVQLVLTHARVVNERAALVNEWTQTIVGSPLASGTEGLMAHYASYQRAGLATKNADRAVLFLLALIAVLSAATAIILRMRHIAHELRRTSARLAEALASLRIEQAKERELSELKTKFVSMTSHEFRTPLSMIMSSSELLAAYGNKWPPEKLATHFTRIKDATVRMTRMLDAILMIGRSDAGMLTFSPQPLDLHRFCSETVDAAVGGSESARIQQEGPEVGGVVLADETLLRHILQNLLSNAVKYSPPGSPVQLKVRREADDVLFEVRDHGIGIPDEDQKRLFETFHRGRNVGSVAGSGLGLAIVKRAIDLHGGELQLESRVGVGTCFVARVPCASCSDSESEQRVSVGAE